MTARILPFAAALLAATALTPAHAQDGAYFVRTASFPVYLNAPEGTDPAEGTAAEIITATPDGLTLVYSDSPGERIGLIDITDPAAPKAAGTVAMGGEPTSVTIVGGLALVAVNTSESKANPSGHLTVVDLATKAELARCDVGGQPDSVATSADGKVLAVVVENERDEDVNDGAIPQMPSGQLAIFDLGADGRPANCDAARIVALTGLSDIAPDDAEPEFVDVNADGIAAVTLQENNWIALIDLASGTVVGDFTAGAATLTNVDHATDKVISPTETIADVPREPDAIGWLDADRFVTANEGDLAGGSRSFTIFGRDGTVEYESANLIELLATEIGAYPEKRARAKGTEPEGIEVATFGADRLFFVGSERASIISVFADKGAGLAPELLQVLPTGVGPEGLHAIPERNLFVVASEEDSAEDGIRSIVSIYARTGAAPAYPMIVSARDEAGIPMGWGALSSLAPNLSDPTKLWAVPDSFYAQTRILTIDTSKTPAVITDALQLTKDGATVDYDAEGVVERPDGGFWVVSEGNPEREEDPTHSLLVQVAADGTVQAEIGLPDALVAQGTRYGYEGVAVVGSGADEKVWVAIQREWKDDPAGQVKLGVYTPATGEWAFVAYPLETPAKGWVGLSEITAVDVSTLLVLERDDQGGPDASLKAIYRVDLTGVTPVAYGQTLPVVEKTLAIDLLPALRAPGGWTPDKPEGFTVGGDGTAYFVTDNDGVDGAVGGEVQFQALGKAADLF